jgi:hypothetical protein
MKIVFEIDATGEITRANIDDVELKKRKDNLRAKAFTEGHLNGILTFQLLNFSAGGKYANPTCCLHSASCATWCPP